MDEISETLLGLFTEIAIIEHLTRARLEQTDGLLRAGELGILNYFIRNHHGPDTISGMAWAFQEDQAHTASKVAGLEAAGLVSVSPPGSRESSALVNVTDAGREAQARKIEAMAPEFHALVAEIPRDDLAATLRTLRDIRHTMDNLPDR